VVAKEAAAEWQVVSFNASGGVEIDSRWYTLPWTAGACDADVGLNYLIHF